MDNIIQEIRLNIQKAGQDKANLKGTHTLTTSSVRLITRQGYPKIKHLSKEHVFQLCETLLASGDWREKTIAFQWAFRIRSKYTSQDFQRFDDWLAKYITGWGSCDDFCTHSFGHLVYAYPEVIPSLLKWTESPNLWFRRGAAVVLIYGIRRGNNFEAGFDVPERLLMDPEDLVRKGYGWMLKEISNLAPIPVFEFVLERKGRMPRTSLRYAIEKLEPKLRIQAMSK